MFDSPWRLLLVFALALLWAAALAAPVHFVFRALTTPSSRACRLSGPRATAYFGFVLVGSFAIVAAGVSQLLTWLPVLHLPVGPVSLAQLSGVIVGFGAVYAVSQLEALPALRRRALVDGAVVQWMKEFLPEAFSVGPKTLEDLAHYAHDANVSEEQREVAKLQLVLSRALLERDARIEAKTTARIVEEQREREQARADEAAVRKASEYIARERQAQHVMQERIRAASGGVAVITNLDALQSEEPALVAQEVLDEALRVFSAIADQLPDSALFAQHAAETVAAQVRRLEGVRLVPGAQLRIRWQGDERDGYCEPLVLIEGEVRPLAQAFEYKGLHRLVLAYLLAVALPSAWAWGHGRYDRDHSLLLTSAELARVLLAIRPEQVTPDDLPAPGIRVVRTSAGYALSCLATRPSHSVYEHTLDVRGGRVVGERKKELLSLGEGLLY